MEYERRKASGNESPPGGTAADIGGRSYRNEEGGKWSGRYFSKRELEEIRQIIASDSEATRTDIARRVCEAIDWRRPNGELKAMRARVVLLRMHERGLIQLPPARTKNGNRTRHQREVPLERDEQSHRPVIKRADQLGELSIEIITSADRERNTLWRSYLSHYHYLGWTPVVGAQMRYWISVEGQELALVSFGAASWKVASRDHWIGWTPEQREQRLPWVINNTRYLILPWVNSKNLASMILGMLTKRVGYDWEKAYGIRPALVETFVDSERFAGTCYKAANWIRVGQTKGRGKYDRHHQQKSPIKDVWTYPLRRNPAQFLKSARLR